MISAAAGGKAGGKAKSSTRGREPRSLVARTPHALRAVSWRRHGAIQKRDVDHANQGYIRREITIPGSVGTAIKAAASV